MTLRPEYTLGHSDLNPFLFAAVSEDEAGDDLTVLSVLTRLGLDPWAEAGQLANLPREAAIPALTALLCQASPKTTDTDSIAARLVDFLPRRGVPPIPTPKRESVYKMKRRPPIWLVCIAAAVAWFVFLSYMKADPALEPPSTDVTSQ